MAIPHYLAMTAAEMAFAASLPPRTAWMACHFSPYSTGLSNLPERFPTGNLLILNDRIPIRRHDPERIAGELNAVLSRFSCSGLLLDFQNPRSKEMDALIAHLSGQIHVPLGISKEHHQGDAAIFLPPVPENMTAAAYLAPWGSKKIWLETALGGHSIVLSENGAASHCLDTKKQEPVHSEPALHCHYTIRPEAKSVRFDLWRTSEDLQALLDEVSSMGVQLAVGLYQEMQRKIR